MLVISDTSIISNLAIIGRLDVLERLHDQVVIPAAVCLELEALSNHEAALAIREAFKRGVLSRIAATQEEQTLAASFNLDAGEAEAIAVAYLRHADVLCIDEAKGREVAMQLHLPIKGLLRLLLDAKHSGVLSQVGPCLDDLRSKARFFMTDRLMERVRSLAGE